MLQFLSVVGLFFLGKEVIQWQRISRPPQAGHPDSEDPKPYDPKPQNPPADVPDHAALHKRQLYPTAESVLMTDEQLYDLLGHEATRQWLVRNHVRNCRA